MEGLLKHAMPARIRPARRRSAPWSLGPKTALPGVAGVVAGLRFYSPGLARWTSRDPIGEEGGANTLAFSLNAPIQLVDVLGMLTQSDVFYRLNFVNAWLGGSIVYADSGLKDIILTKLHSAAWAISFFTSGGAGFFPALNMLRLPAFTGNGLTEVHELTHAYLWQSGGVTSTYWQEGIAYVGDHLQLGVIDLHRLEERLYSGDCTKMRGAAESFWAGAWLDADYRGKQGYLPPSMTPFPLTPGHAAAAKYRMGWRLSCRRIAAMYNTIIKEAGCCFMLSCDPNDSRPNVIPVGRDLPPELE